MYIVIPNPPLQSLKKENRKERQREKEREREREGGSWRKVVARGKDSNYFVQEGEITNTYRYHIHKQPCFPGEIHSLGSRDRPNQ